MAGHPEEGGGVFTCPARSEEVVENNWWGNPIDLTQDTEEEEEAGARQQPMEAAAADGENKSQKKKRKKKEAAARKAEEDRLNGHVVDWETKCVPVPLARFALRLACATKKSRIET